MHPSRAVVHPSTNIITLLQSLLTSPKYPTIVLVCAPQAEFLHDLLYGSSLENTTPANRLLRPTLHALSIAPHISMVFAPTVSHLRAWLTVADQSSFAPAPPCQPFDAAKTHKNNAQYFQIRGQRNGRLVVWNLVRSSCHTSEWSVQGLSETVAALIDCAQRLDCSIALAEAAESPAELEQHHEGTEEEDEAMHGVMTEYQEEDARATEPAENTVMPESPAVQNDIYQRLLPMLNGSSQRAGLSDSAAWSGRTVEVGVVLKRWFEFSVSGI